MDRKFLGTDVTTDELHDLGVCFFACLGFFLQVLGFCFSFSLEE